jgi:SSS family solute:Na+ symporter
MVIIAFFDPESKNNPKGLEIDATMFRPSNGFIVGASIVTMMIIGLYTYFW